MLLGHLSSRVDFAFTLLFYCLPCFFAQFCVVALVLVSKKSFSLVVAALRLGCYDYIVFSSILFPPRLFARPFRGVHVLGDFLPPPPISLPRAVAVLFPASVCPFVLHGNFRYCLFVTLCFVSSESPFRYRAIFGYVLGLGR